MTALLEGLFGGILYALGWFAVRLLSFGRYPPAQVSYKLEIILRCVGMLLFVIIWLALAYLLGWKPRGA